MVHPDERRDPEQQRRQRMALALSDPDALFRRYEGLLARDQRRKAREQQLTDRIAALELEVERAKRHRDEDLTRRLASAMGALEAYRAETRRLKADLQRVRSSMSMRVGRAALSPVHFVKGLGQGRPQSNLVEPAVVPSEGDLEAQKDADVADTRITPPAVPVSERTLAELVADLDAEPTATHLARVLGRMWFTLGDITAPAKLLRKHSSLVAMLDPKERVLAERILGEQRLLDEGVSIPPRSRGVAYVAEPDRVMYCVHSTPVFNSNGYSTRTRGVASGLLAAGTDPVVVARPGYPWDSSTDRPAPRHARHETVVDGVPYVHLPGADLTKTPVDRYFDIAADAFVREARRQRPSVIQSASNHRTALPALIAARRLGVPFVYEVRGLWEITTASAKDGWGDGDQFHSMASLETLVAQQADTVLAITSQLADELERRGVDRSRITIAPNAVDTDEFAPIPRDEAFAARHGIPTDVPVIGFAGSIVGYEGLSTLLEASAELERRGTRHAVIIAGSGTALGELKALREASSLSSVKFLGRLPIEDMPRLLSTFDVMPLPRESNAVTEMVSPLKPLEAFSSMKPVVASDVAPHRDLVGSAGERGLLFPPSDALALADALEEIFGDRDAAAAMGRRARAWVLHQRTWRSIAAVMRRAHGAARKRAASLAEAGPTIDRLKIGIVADEFTTTTVAATAVVVPLDRDRWRDQLASEQLDMIFIESAWEGNGGTWHRAVGHYSAEESADLDALLEAARDRGIPSVFWNKEDPVHFNRFRRAASLCDHVFTTDAGVIPKYLATPGSLSRTVSSLPFYAQPLIHNPLPPGVPFTPTVAHAGTYYGDRYADRSKRLRGMLEAARPYGLTLYDRQADNPGSPYRFPVEYQQYVAGSLPYDEVLDAYKSHVAHLNVNSVEDSPTMYSRRVVEIAASGGLVLSSESRGVQETFGSTIPSTNDSGAWRSMLHDWTTNPVSRTGEAWLQLRAVHRAHTAAAALALMARTAGIPVDVKALPSYAVVLEAARPALLAALAAQSVRPTEVFVPNSEVEAAESALAATGIQVRPVADVARTSSEWLAKGVARGSRTHFEDMLYATRFGEWDRIMWRSATATDQGATLASTQISDVAVEGLVRTSQLIDRGAGDSPRRVLELLMPDGFEPTEAVPAPATQVRLGQTILVAGHDLKFAGALIDALRAAGNEVLLDQWTSHTDHDPAVSKALLERADVVWAEWGLGNAVWYSSHLKPHQRMIVRVHLQELQRPFLRRVKHDRVDRYVFVGELIRLAAVESHGVPASKCSVIPNFVDVDNLARQKHDGAEFHLGFVGMVPQRKRLDLAVDLLERLLHEDDRYRLFIKGRRPEEFFWMAERQDEMSFYDRIYRRAEALNETHPGAIVFEAHGDDMPEWYRKIGIALSTSDYESFHFTIADGAASGALPASLAWAGAEYLYPREWLYDDVESMARGILERSREPRSECTFIRERFDQNVVLERLVELTLGG